MLINTERGPVPVEDVTPGDMVYTWRDGSLSRNKVVAGVTHPAQDVFKLRTRNRAIRASANHPFLVVLRKPSERNPRNGQYMPVEWRTRWLRLDELRPEDLIVVSDHLPMPEQPQALPDGTPIDADVAWLLGEITGDGHLERPKFGATRIAAFRQPVRDRIRRIVKAHWNANAKDHPTGGVIISSRALTATLLAAGYGALAHEKCVPDVVKLLPPTELGAYLEGYAEADGWFDEYRGHQTYSSCSRRLVAEVRALHMALGDRVTNITPMRRTRPIVIKGKTVKHARDQHVFIVYPRQADRQIRGQETMLNTYGVRRVLPDHSFTIDRVASVKPDGREATYDIEVEGSHNYIADGFLVHNSSLVQWAATRAGIPNVPRTSEQQIAACDLISVPTAINTRGALLHQPGHIAISLGNGRTIEASQDGVPIGQLNATGRKWDQGGKLRGAKGYL